MNIQYFILKEDENLPLKQILKNKLYISSRLITKLKTSDSILVNDKSEFVNYIVKYDDKIYLDFDKMNTNYLNDDLDNNLRNNSKNVFLNKFDSYDFPLNILYEDDFLLIVDKPNNMLIHPTCDNRETTLANAVATYFSKKNINTIHILTRLDKDTSGICIFAKNEYIQELFEKKKNIIHLKKEYLCIVNGIVQKDHDFIEKNIARSPHSIITREVNENGDYAKTEYNVLKRLQDKNATVLNVVIHTGRTHQIRVHMASIGHVLLGDDLYANDYEKQDILNFINRQALHCIKVSFFHPITNEFIEINSKIPNDIYNVII